MSVETDSYKAHYAILKEVAETLRLSLIHI